MEITGRLFKKTELQEGTAKSTGNPWKKREFIIETLDNYPKKVCFSLMNDRVHLIDQYQDDSIITVSFDIESREYEGRWFTSLRAWKVDFAQTAPMQGTPAPGYQQPQGFPQQPVYQQPQYAQPMQQPVYQQPVYQQPVYQQPVQQPVYQQAPPQGAPNPMDSLPQQPPVDTFTDNGQPDDLPF